MKIRKISAFSLIEVVMSIFIIGIVAAMSASLIPQSLAVTQETQDIVRASSLAQKYIEKVKSDLSYSALYDAATEGVIPPVTLSNEFTNSGYFTVGTTVTDLETELIDSVVKPVLKELDVEYIRTSDKTSILVYSTLLQRPR